MKKFGLWVVPENAVYNEFEEIIHKYSSKYDSSVFIPHMKLYGVMSSTEDQIIEVVEQVVGRIDPFRVEIGIVEFSTTYFQCVFARMKTSAELLNAHLALKNGFNAQEKHVFMPHASLVYGDFDMKEREKISKEIKLQEKNFAVRKIAIVQTDSLDPKDWDIIRQVKLG